MKHLSNTILLALLISAALALINPVLAQQAETPAAAEKDSIKQKLEAIVKGAEPEEKDHSKLKKDPARPEALPASATSPQTIKLYEQALQDYYQYRSRGLEHRSAVFGWQLFSAKLIFAVALGLVVCGIVFAGIQFRAGLRQASTKLDSQIELGSNGVKISSPVVGIIILFISLAFFYLYLIYVYPIEDAF